jgi:hypothetical protein
LRLHLTRFVQDWQAKQSASSSPASRGGGEPDEQLSAEADAEEAGFFDLIESTTEGLNSVAQIQQRMTDIANELNSNLTERNAEMGQVNSSPESASASAFKRITNRLADDMDQFARRTRVELTEFERQLSDALTNTGTSASLALDFGVDSPAVAALPALADNVAVFGRSMADNAKTARNVRDSIARSPRITTAYNRAKKSAVAALDETARVLSNGSETCLRVAQSIRDLIADGKPRQ